MNKETELDMNDLIRNFNEYSTDYTKTACRYYEDYLINYQKEKLNLQQENQELKEQLKKADSITQSCIFNGKKESELNYRVTLNLVEELRQKNKELKKCIIADSNKIHYWVDKCEKLEKILDEIREYISNKKAIINTDVIRIFDLFEIDEQGYISDLLQILDKGVKDEQ